MLSVNADLANIKDRWEYTEIDRIQNQVLKKPVKLHSSLNVKPYFIKVFEVFLIKRSASFFVLTILLTILSKNLNRLQIYQPFLLLLFLLREYKCPWLFLCLCDQAFLGLLLNLRQPQITNCSECGEIHG